MRLPRWLAAALSPAATEAFAVAGWGFVAPIALSSVEDVDSSRSGLPGGQLISAWRN